MFPSPTGYMLWSFRFSLLIRGISHRFIYRLSIFLKSWTSIGHLSNSTGSTVTTLNIVFSVPCYLELHNAIFFYYQYFVFLNDYKGNILLFHNVQTTNSTFVGKNEIYSKYIFVLFFETEGRHANAKHRRQLTTWQFFLSSREEIS